MIFKKASDYLTSIFIAEIDGSDFNLYSSNDKLEIIGGNIKDTGESYFLSKSNKRIGLKINNGSYIFIQSREKFADTTLFKKLSKKDNKLNSKVFDEVEYVEFFESNKNNNTVTKIEYLVNKSSYLLIGYYKMFEDYNQSISILDQFLLSKTLKKLGITEPQNPYFDVRSNKNIMLLIPDNFHLLYEIKANGKNLDNLFFRKSLIKKVNCEMLDADVRFYSLSDESKDCIDLTHKNIQSKFDEER